MFKKLSIALLAILSMLASGCDRTFIPVRNTMALSGLWHFALDTASVGITEKWYTLSLNKNIQ
ncbi:MAG TPA: hypothetical protein VMV77_11905 [Bacteroidales bacterium]|nr:hypothetical protein [Bacteroidales bacterium]